MGGVAPDRMVISVGGAVVFVGGEKKARNLSWELLKGDYVDKRCNRRRSLWGRRA